jgi:ribosomal protein S18 acetylase RimI-like enzyme
MLPSSWDISEATVADAPRIWTLQRLAYQSEARLYEDDQLPPLLESEETLRALFASHLFLKALLAERLVGSVRGCLEAGTCYVGRLIVDPEFQNRGLGAALMQALEASFPQATRFELFTGHLSDRPLHLYRKLGYQEYRRQPVHAGLELVFLEKRRVE